MRLATCPNQNSPTDSADEADVDCVRRVSYDATACGGDAVKVLDGPNGVIAIRYERFDGTDVAGALRLW